MSIRADHVRLLVVQPALRHIGLHSDAAEELVMGTMAQESLLGAALKQIGGGPALGLPQMEPATHDDIWRNFLKYKPALAAKVAELAPVRYLQHDEVRVHHTALAAGLEYAAAMCRVHYLRDKAPLPDAGDLAGQAATWKRVYNTALGHGTVAAYIRNYNKLVKGIA